MWRWHLISGMFWCILCALYSSTCTAQGEQGQVGRRPIFLSCSLLVQTFDVYSQRHVFAESYANKPLGPWTDDELNSVRNFIGYCANRREIPAQDSARYSALLNDEIIPAARRAGDQARAEHAPVERGTAPAPSALECRNLDAAVKTALDSQIPAAALDRFGGRLVAGWRRSDYQAFLTVFEGCQNREDVAPVLNAFPGETRTLLSTLRERAIDVASSLRTQEQGALTVAAAPVSAAPVPASATNGSSPPTSTPAGVAAVPQIQAINLAAPVPHAAESKPTQRPTAASGRQSQNSQPATTHKASNSTGAYIAFGLLTLFLIVLTGIVAGWNQNHIVVFRNFDDLAIVFFMGAILIGGGFIGFYFSGAEDKTITTVIWAATALGVALLLGWTLARTWSDQMPPSAWRFALAFITKMSLGILFVNNLVAFISPGGKIWNERSRNRASGLLGLLVLTPVIVKLVRDHEGIWMPRNLLNRYEKQRVGV